MSSKISLSQDIARNSCENTKNKHKILIGCHFFGDVWVFKYPFTVDTHFMRKSATFFGKHCSKSISNPHP